VIARRRPVLVALAGVAAAGALGALLLGNGSGDMGTSPEARAKSAARSFLARYVDDEGRVVRWDQGETTVSEGQSYAMLLATAVGDRQEFRRVWSWTAKNLQRPDGLFSWLWEGGEVADRNAASDADLGAAYALLLASHRFHEHAYGVEALRIGRAILAEETVSIKGRPVLVAGNWAQALPATIDPSYLIPRAFEALRAASGERSWSKLAQSGREIVARLTSGPDGLAPDWAQVAADGAVRPIPAPGGEPPPRYSYDAVRVPLWMAQSCDPRDRRLAARSARFLSAAAADGISSAYSLEGEPLGGEGGAVALVGAGAASAAAGERADALKLLDRAEADVEAAPTYYSAALLALGRVLLTTHLVGRC
jgi:endo-1,4-beta-D-glucanase Y